MAKKSVKIPRKGKKGREKIELNIEKILKSVESDECRPYTKELAKLYKVSYSKMFAFIRENQEIREAMDLRLTEITEIAEESLQSILENPDHPQHAQTVKWVLAVQNQKYREKQEITHKGNISFDFGEELED